MDFLKASDEILSVGEFSRRFKMLINTRIPELWLRGEVSNVRLYGSGHTYFTLKDADASISAVLFKGYAAAAPFKLRDGMKVLLFGEISLYEVRGTYQLVVKCMMSDGVGDLARRFEELKKRLSEEGLFDSSLKIPIPPLVRKIAAVTSPDGAAVRDFLRILERRDWRGSVYILPAKVQGAEAAAEIAAQVKFADEFAFADGSGFDAIVVMRGGGSFEDLFAFSEEIVARAVAGARTPIISAVGHEIDFSLSDFAADLRAETPSAAAELISSSYLDCVARAQEARDRAEEIVRARLDELRGRLDSLGEFLRLNSPEGKIRSENLRLDEIASRLDSLAVSGISKLKLALEALRGRLAAAVPGGRVALLRQRLDGYAKRLELLGVEKTLERGFALVLDCSGRPVAQASRLKAGERVDIRFNDGVRGAEILPERPL